MKVAQPFGPGAGLLQSEKFTDSESKGRPERVVIGSAAIQTSLCSPQKWRRLPGGAPWIAALRSQWRHSGVRQDAGFIVARSGPEGIAAPLRGSRWRLFAPCARGGGRRVFSRCHRV